MKIINKGNSRITYPDINFSIGSMEVKEVSVDIFKLIRSNIIVEVIEKEKTVEKEKVDRVQKTEK
jgi:hypothetical protein